MAQEKEMVSDILSDIESEMREDARRENKGRTPFNLNLFRRLINEAIDDLAENVLVRET